ncbi:MAG: hypothetical protein ACMG6E_09515 [Candidatus Roizmanbacteria bacterium]
MDKNFALFGKFILVALVLGAIGGGSYYVGMKRSTSSEPSPTPYMKKTSDDSVDTEMMQQETAPQDTPSDIIMVENGSVEGELGYPAGGIPPLKVFAISNTDESVFFYTETGSNQGTFTIKDVSPGTYHVIAYKGDFAGAWTKSVPCGLTVDCTDHSFIDVVVKPGETATGIKVGDWYAPEGTFPEMPH